MNSLFGLIQFGSIFLFPKALRISDLSGLRHGKRKVTYDASWVDEEAEIGILLGED